MTSKIDRVEAGPDVLDQAKSVEQLTTDLAVKATLDGVEKIPRDFTPPWCYGCAHEIPAKRLATGAFRCIECQTKVEAQLKLYGGRKHE